MSAAAVGQIKQSKPARKTLRSSLQDTLRSAAGHVKNKASRDALSELSALRTIRHDKGKEKESAPSSEHVDEERSTFMRRFSSKPKVIKAPDTGSSRVPSSSPATTPPPRPPKDPTWSPFQPPTLSQATFSSPTLHSPPPLSMDAFSSPHNGSTSTLVTNNGHRPLTRRPPISGTKSRLTSPSTPSLTSSNSPTTVRQASQRRSTDSNLPSSTPSPSPSKPVNAGSQTSKPPTVKSHSSTHLPLVPSTSLSARTTSPTPPPSKFRRNSSNTPASDTRTSSPSSSSSVFAQNKFTTSTASLLLPLSPQREAIRTAASFILKESLRPPADLGPLTKQWSDEMESRTRALARLERNWIVGSGTGTSSGEERERKAFCEALRDGYVLCQLLNKWRPNIVSRIDHREDGITKHSNITRFVAVAGALGVTTDALCSRDDFIVCTPDSMMRVAQTILALSKLTESVSLPKPIPRSPYGEGKDKGLSIASTPNLTTTSPTKKRISPPGPPKDIPSPGPGPAPPPSHSALRPLILAPAASRTSLASSATTDSTTYSSLLYDKQSRFGSIRTNVTEATTMVLSSGAPSLSRSDAKNAALELERADQADLLPNVQSPVARRRYSDKKPNGLQISANDSSDIVHDLPRTPNVQGRRDRRSSEATTDLMRVMEETEADGAVNPSQATSAVKERRDSANNIKLGKGKWPDDFMAVFSASPPTSPTIQSEFPGSTPEPRKRKISFRSSAPVPISAPFPDPAPTEDRRTTGSPSTPPRPPRAGGSIEHQPSPQGSPSKREGLSSALEPNSNGVRRSNTRGHLVPKIPSNGEDRSPYRTKFHNASTPSIVDSTPTSSAPIPIPFPRRASLDVKYQNSHGLSIASPRLDTLAASSETLLADFEREIEMSSAPLPRPLSRTRHHSELEDQNPRGALERARSGGQDDLKFGRRSRFESMMDISNHDQNGNKSTIRKTLIVKEDGVPATRYQLGNCIGRGQFGSVYRALNLNTGQMVAVKQIRLEGLPETEVTQLMREVDLLKRLSHPSIVKYEGMTRDADNLSIVLEYAENGSLGQTLKYFGKLNERLVAGYVTKILEGLHYLHSSQVVHCDLKAANILTTKNGNVKLTDFGVSLNLRAMENINNDVAGTPNWMAPEVIELKGASTASDIWSLGCTVIELLTGKPPYAEIQNGLSVMFHIVEDPSPTLPAGCSAALKDFFSLCFSKDPAKRPSAELLFEHPWLKNNWGEHKELRPQDSIPFLRRVSADLKRTSLAHQISFAESSTPPSASTPVERRHTFVKTNFSQAIECRVCYTSVKKSAMLCQGCSLICHSRCTAETPVNCDLQEQMRTFAEHQQQQPPTEPRARSPSNLGSTSSPAEGGLSSSPLSFPHIMAGFRKLRHSTSSMTGDQSQAEARTEDQPPIAAPPVANSVRSSSSGGATATTNGSRFSARASLHLRNSVSPVADDSSQRAVATPSPAPPTSLNSSDKRARKKPKDTDQGRSCVIQ